MLYFFHHYELPVILQQAQLQQLLLRSHHGMGGMMGLAGIAALASGAAYHDAPGTGTQATPPTTQSTTQTVQNTAQSTTQTSPSVSTAQTNTTHTGDVVSSRATSPETTATGTNTSTENSDRSSETSTQDDITRSPDKNPVSMPVESGIKIEEINRKQSDSDIKVARSDNSASGETEAAKLPISSAANDEKVRVGVEKVDSSTLDRRRDQNAVLSEVEPPPSAGTTVTRLAPRASPEADYLD